MSAVAGYAVGLGFLMLVVAVTVFGWRCSMARAIAMIDEALK